MGVCVLCGKSAGLFYSLHKKCYQRFQSSADPIVNLLASKLGDEPVSQLAQQLHEQIHSFAFVGEAQQRTLVRGLEAFSNQEFERKDNITASSSAWVELLEYLSIDESLFLNPSFIGQQKMLPNVQSLHAGQLPASNCNADQFPGERQVNEELWWHFSGVRYEQLQPRTQKRQWSVIAQILSSALPNKRKQPALQRKEIGQGDLWFTNQRMCFAGEKEVVSIAFGNIQVITPEYNGVTLQYSELATMPQTFRCEQGQLLYHFLQYVQKVGN